MSTAVAQGLDSLRIDLNTALEIALSENPKVKVADMEITKKVCQEWPGHCFHSSISSVNTSAPYNVKPSISTGDSDWAAV